MPQCEYVVLRAIPNLNSVQPVHRNKTDLHVQPIMCVHDVSMDCPMR